MGKYLLYGLILASVCGVILGLGLDLSEDEEGMGKGEGGDRTLILTTGSGGINLTQLLPLLALAAAGLLPLLCLCALSLVLLWHLKDKDSGYGGYHTSYSDYARSFGLGDLDWEKLSIVDWVEMGEETFRKFEPSNLSCQTRLVCELHQNAAKFGPLANGVVRAFGYLKYLELFNIPEILKELVAEYSDAADKGRSLKKDCGDIYPDCEFSINQIYDKYLLNEIQ